MSLIVEIVVAVVGALISYWLLPKIGQEKAKKVKDYLSIVGAATQTAVYNVEQLSKNANMTSEEKKELARKNTKEILKLFNMTASDVIVDTTIEATVKAMEMFFRTGGHSEPETVDLSNAIQAASN